LRNIEDKNQPIKNLYFMKNTLKTIIKNLNNKKLPKNEVMLNIKNLCNLRGVEKYTENITLLEHSLQTATFAERDKSPPSLIVACLLHDIGDFLITPEEYENILKRGENYKHEIFGFNILNSFFPLSGKRINILKKSGKYIKY
jgi:predicted HD phosphohydrolase